MKLTDLHMQKIEPRLKCPIKLAYGEISAVEAVIVRITTDTGLVGHGEASTIPFVTGETPTSITEALDRFRVALIGRDALAIGAIHAVMDGMIVGNTAAKAAVDIALYDILGKALDQPLYRILGGHSHSFATDICLSIDSPDTMARMACDRADQGFTAFKIKAGREISLDIEAVRRIRQAVGPTAVLRIDANQGWTVTDTLKAVRELRDCDITGIEQPVPHWDIEGMARIRKHTAGIDLIADESLHSPQDAIGLVRSSAADMFSIKLAKAGGIYPALQINAIAQASGTRCMMGCMLESGIAISAAAHLKAAQQNISVGDTDAAVLVEEPRIEAGFTVEGELITLSDRPGLGLEVRL